MADKKLRIGIVGCGGIANSHMAQYIQMDDVEVVAGCDIVEGKAEEFFSKYDVEGVNFYTSDLEMYEKENLDAVSICTYNATHKECTINALKAGCHVLLEKPMCVTTEEAVEMMKVEKETGKILSIGFQPRFDDDMKIVKKVVQSGVLGKIYYIQTGGGRREGIPFSPEKTSFIEASTGVIGAMGDIGCYSLDMVLNAIGYPKPLTVTGYTSDFFGKNPKYSGYGKKGTPEFSKIFGVDDFAAAFVRLEGDIVLDFRISWAMHMDTPGDTLILGTEGGLRIPSTNCWNGAIGKNLTLYHAVGDELVETEIPVKSTGEGKENSFSNCFYGKVRSFLDAIKTGGKAPIPTSEILYNQAIIDHIIKSAKIKKEIEVVIPEV